MRGLIRPKWALDTNMTQTRHTPEQVIRKLKTSEAAFAALCGASPIPASSGTCQRHRLNRGGNRQANCALSDNDSAYRSKPWRHACEVLGLSFQSSEEQNRWLRRYLAIYNGRRCHMALADRTPFQQLALLRATE